MKEMTRLGQLHARTHCMLVRAFFPPMNNLYELAWHLNLSVWERATWEKAKVAPTRSLGTWDGEGERHDRQAV